MERGAARKLRISFSFFPYGASGLTEGNKPVLFPVRGGMAVAGAAFQLVPSSCVS